MHVSPTRPVAPQAGTFDDATTRLSLEVQFLYELLPSAQWVNIAAVALIFGLLLQHVEAERLVGWLAFAVIIIASRIAISMGYRRSVKSEDRAQFWFNLFLVGTTLYGILWSGTAILLVPAEPAAIAGLTGLLMCGLVAGAVAMSSVNIKVFLVFATSTLWPYAAYLVASRQDPHSLFGWLILLYSVIVSFVAAHVHSYFHDLVRLHLRTRFLEREVQREADRRKVVEKALLDNTLEEGLADQIRHQSRVLAEEPAVTPGRFPTVNPANFSYYVEKLNRVMQDQLVTAQDFAATLGGFNLPEEQRKYLALIDRLLGSAVSAIKRITADEGLEQVIGFENEIIKIHWLVNYLCDDVPLIYKAKLITLRKSFDPHLPRVVYGDKESLSRSLWYLILNANQYTDGGSIEVMVERESEEDDHLWLRFSVKDTGVGMPRKQLAALLSGSGEGQRGLASVKRLVTLLGGELFGESTPGVGSTMGFRLRFAKELAGV